MSATPQASFLSLAALMFAAGLGIPVFAAFNSALGKQIGGPIAATAVAFAIGLCAALALVAVTGAPNRSAFTFGQPHIWFGALFILFYAVSVSFAGPRIGIGNAIFFVLLGQLIAAALIDHFGWFGAIPSALTLRRGVGIAVMAVGVYLAKKSG